MPHRSRLSILLLDLPPEHHAAGTAFWAGATGRAAAPDPTDGDWASLGSFADGWHVEIQRTGSDTPPRWHVDIETDDLVAEVARLEGLGATRHRDLGSFRQMLDPAGLVFCVVGIQTGEEFERYAVTWEGPNGPATRRGGRAGARRPRRAGTDRPACGRPVRG